MAPTPAEQPAQEEAYAGLFRSAAASLIQQVQAAREDFAAFFEFAWRDHRGQYVKIQPFQERWLQALDASSHVILMSSRGSGKSELFQARVIWTLGRNPDLRIKIVCQSDKKARETLAAIKQHIERNPAIRLVFPTLQRAKGGEWSAHSIVVERHITSKHPSVDARGIFSAVTGARTDILWADDMVDYRIAVLEPGTRDAATAKWKAEFLPTLEPDGRVWITATPWHHDDVVAREIKTGEYHVVSTPTGTDKDPFKPLWEAKFPREKLMKLYRLLGPVEYNRAYRLLALSDEDVIFKPAWIRWYDRSLIGDPEGYFCVVCIDPAISLSAKADFFAVVVLLHDFQRNFTFVVDAWHAQLTFRDQATTIIRTARAWKADRVVLEVANYEGALAQEVAELSPTPLPIEVVKPRESKARRLRGVTGLFQAGRVHFHPALNAEVHIDRAVQGDIVAELREFDPKGRKGHDDMADALSMGLAFLRDMAPQAGDETDWDDESSVRFTAFGG